MFIPYFQIAQINRQLELSTIQNRNKGGEGKDSGIA